MKIGFIGLGIMGSRMANNLIKGGHELCIYNRTKEKAEKLIESGAEFMDSPKEAAKNCNVVFTMLSEPEVVREVAAGKDGFLKYMNENSIWADCTTVNPSFAKEINEIARKHKIRYMDTPVAGSTVPAEKGELTFLVGGSEKDFKEIREYLELMGKNIFHMGENGSGAAMKMVINMLLGQSMQAFSEAMALGSAMNLPEEILYEILLGGPVTASYLSAKKEKFQTGNYEAEFPLKWMHKDLFLASKTAYEQNVSLPSTNSVKETFGLAKMRGLADKDFSAIFDFLNKNKVNDRRKNQ